MRRLEGGSLSVKLKVEGEGPRGDFGWKRRERRFGEWRACRCDEVMEKVRVWEESLGGRGTGWEIGRWSCTGDRGSGVSLSPVEREREQS